MKTWKWIQPNNRIWKVVSDPIRGSIIVYDENGKEILKRQGLTKKALKMIERNFLNIVADDLRDKDNPMYA